MAARIDGQNLAGQSSLNKRPVPSRAPRARAASPNSFGLGSGRFEFHLLKGEQIDSVEENAGTGAIRCPRMKSALRSRTRYRTRPAIKLNDRHSLCGNNLHFTDDGTTSEPLTGSLDIGRPRD